MEEVISKFDSFAEAVAKELNKKINDVKDCSSLMLYVEVFNECYGNSEHCDRQFIFYVHDNEDVIRLLSKPYVFTTEYVCEMVTKTINLSAHFLYYNSNDGMSIVADESLIDMLQDNMVDIVKEVLTYHKNEVYHRFYASEIFGLIRGCDF